MLTSDEHIRNALEPVEFLHSTLLVGAQWRDEALAFCRKREFSHAVHCGQELYELGLRESDTYVQGVACHLLGSIYFALEGCGNKHSKALGYFVKSVNLFHTYSINAGHNEGVVWISIGRLQGNRCDDHQDKYQDAILAFTNAVNLFKASNDALAERAVEWKERASRRLTDYLTCKQKAQLLAKYPPARKAMPVHPGGSIGTPPAKSRAKNAFETMALSVALLTIGVSAGFGVSELIKAIPLFEGWTIGFLIACIPMIGIYLFICTGHLCTIPRDQVAILEYRDVTKSQMSGLHFVLPWMGRIRGHISLSHDQVILYMSEFAARNGFALGINAEFDYQVKNAVNTWGCIKPFLEPKQIWRWERPSPVKETKKCVQEEVRTRAKLLLKKIAEDESEQGAFRDKANLDAFVLGRWAEEAQRLGIDVTRVRITAHVRD